MADRDQRPSEFGGRPGLVQLETDGHTPTPSERQMQLRSVDPSPRWENLESVYDEAIETGDRIA